MRLTSPRSARIPTIQSLRTLSRLTAACLAASVIVSIPDTARAQGAGRWLTLSQTNSPIAREECSFAQAGNKFYLLGGRGVQPVQEFNPATRTWRNLKNTPVEINHFQALSVNGLIYVICALNGSYPHEVPIPNIYIFDPLSDTWIKGMAIPSARLRGSAGLVEANGKLYSVLGIKDGHSSGWVPFLDEFDPATSVWRPMPDAPRARDHFQAAVNGGRIYAIGGRRSGTTPDIFADLEKVDYFDLNQVAPGTWTTLPSPASDLKIRRSGSIVAALGDEILVAGGGSNSNGTMAHSQTDALNIKTHAWRSLDTLNRGRQVTGGFINNGALYVASGSGGSGGSPVLQTMEAWFPGDSTAPTGEALVAGNIGIGEAVYNMGMIPSGQMAARKLSLKHLSGNQGVLVSGIKVVGDASFTVKPHANFPLLVRPNYPVTVDLSFASTGAIPAETYLEVTAAIPPGLVVKIPLEANKTPLALVRNPGRLNRVMDGAAWKGSWEVLFEGRLRNAKGQVRPLP